MVQVGDRISSGMCVAEVLRKWTTPAGRPLYVGLSGGMGAGKSTFASVWANLGAQVIVADDLAREVVAPGSAGLAEIVEAFGPTVVDDNGHLNRPELGRLAFSSAEKKELLESITHPRIAALALIYRDEAGAEDIVVYDVPLLVENQMEHDFDCVVMLDAPVDLRVHRLSGRGVSEQVARARIETQATTEQRLPVSNIWVENVGSASDMSDVASRVFGRWLKEKK